MKKVKNVYSRNKHKIRNSLGVYDAYKFYRKNKPKDKQYILTESQFFAIIRKINELLVDSFIKGEDIVFPHRLGRLEKRKFGASVKIKDGKIKTNRPINWDKTLKLWYEDKEAYDNKILVRDDIKEIFTIYYNRIKADYTNKSYYQFTPNRQFKIKLKQSILDGNNDAFLF